MIIENNKKKLVWHRVAARLFVFLLAGSFLFCSSAKAAVTGDYNKPINGTLSASEWNNLIKDFISVNGGEINGNLNIVGNLQATSLAGTYTGTLNSANVSSGAFGSNTGGGNFTFPGYVGIGTTNPAYGLSVNSPTGINSYNGVAGLGKFVLGDPADSRGFIGMYRSAAGPANVDTAGYSLGLGSISDMTFSVGYVSSPTFSGQTERMRITSNGNVGIGTTTPGAYKLFVNGTANFTGTVSAGSFSGPMSGTLSSGNVSAGTFGSNTGGGNYAFTGNVGIGTTTPTAKLSVASGRTEINVFNNSGGEVLDWPAAGLSIRRIDDYTQMKMIQLGHRDDSTYQISNTAVWNFSLSDNTGSKTLSDANTDLLIGGPGDLSLSPAGNIGIGTTNPIAKLDVLSSANSGIWLRDTSNNVVAALSYQSGVNAMFGGGEAGRAVLRSEGRNFIIGTNNASNYIAFGTGLTENMRIAGGGNVGIGTTTPTSAKLVINPSGSYSIDAGGGRVGNITSVADTDAASVAYVKGVIGGGSGSTVGYWTANGTNIYNSNGGNVGIGTTTPGAYKLFVNGNTNINGTLSANSFSGPLTGTVNSTNVSAGAFAANTGGGNFSFPANVGITGIASISGGIIAQRFSSTGIVAAGSNTFKTYDISGATDGPTTDSWHRVLTIPSNDLNYPSFLATTMSNHQARVFFQSKENSWASGWKEFILANSAGDVGIGTTAPAYKLDVNGDVHLTGTLYAGALSGGAMTGTINSGNVSAGTFGSNTGGGNFSLLGNFGIGTNNPTSKLDIFGGNIDIDNTTFASQTGVITKNGTRFIHDFNYGNNGTVTTVGSNTFIGVNAGNFLMGSTATANYQASYNTAVGAYSLFSNTTGYNNTANGYASLYSNTTGNSNTANGYASLYSNTTGNSNTANGQASLNSNTTGNSNTANGQASLYSNTTGGGNTALGMYSGRFIADKSTGALNSNNSIFLGWRTSPLADNQTNQIVIGYDAVGIGSNSVVLGNDNITTTALKGSVGIGTTNPASAKLVINPSGSYSIDAGGGRVGNITSVADTDAASVAYVKGVIGGGSGSTVGYWTANGTNIYNSNGGNVGIGTTTPGAYKLFVNGNTNINGVLSANSLTGTLNAINISAGQFAASTGGGNFSFPGYVGIGTTNPATKLEVYGSGQLIANITDAGNRGDFLSLNSNDGNTNAGAAITFGNVQSRAANSIGWAAIKGLLMNGGGNTTGDLAFLTRNATGDTALTERMRILASGNVGIGTTAPAAKLDVNGNTNITGNLNVTGTITGGAAMTGTLNSANVSSGTFGSNTGGGNYAFTGNVGIGTNSPQNKFQILKASTWNNEATAGLSILSTTLDTEMLLGTDSTSDVGYIQTLQDATNYGNRPLALQPNGGSVGIGTTTPGAYKLFVNGTANFTGTVSAGSFSGPMSGTLSSGNVSSGTFGSNTGGGNYTFPGNVGIGTTNPATKLQVYGIRGTTVSTSTAISSVGGVNVFLYTGALSVGPWSTWMQSMTNDSGALLPLSLNPLGGSVGIGTTAPAAKLDVNGNTNITGNLNVTGTITGGAAMTGTLNAGNVSAGTFGSNTGGGNFALMGNFGIGTTNPGQKLTIQQSSDTNAVRLYGLTVPTAYFDMYINNLGNPRFETNNSMVFNSGGDTVFRTGGALAFNDGTPRSITFNAGQLFLSASGNLGIGTTNPSEAKLVINAGTGMALKAYGNGIFTGTLQTQTGSDFAEEFTTSKDLEQGTVVVMDDNGHKSVRPCNKSYDKTVVGIVSNNPSIIAGRVTSEHKAIIAMMGVVKVKVVDINGTIAKGDLLTTSGVYGYAMKAAKTKPGTIIGKALEDLNSKSGQINVLVNLQ